MLELTIGRLMLINHVGGFYDAPQWGRGSGGAGGGWGAANLLLVTGRFDDVVGSPLLVLAMTKDDASQVSYVLPPIRERVSDKLLSRVRELYIRRRNIFHFRIRNPCALYRERERLVDDRLAARLLILTRIYNAWEHSPACAHE